MKKLILLFILVFTTSIKSNAQLSPNVLRSINPEKGIKYNTNLVLQNGFKLNKTHLNGTLVYQKHSKTFLKPELIWHTSNEEVKISESEISYSTQVEPNEIEDYINELDSRFAPKNCKSKSYKKSGKNSTMETYLITNNLLLIIFGRQSVVDKTKGIVYYEISKV